MSERADGAAYLPDTVIGLAPDAGDMLEQHLLHAPRVLERSELGLARGMQCVHQLAVDIELMLLDSLVSDADGTAPFVSGQPSHDVLGQPALAADAEHDVQLLRCSGCGAQQPA